MVAVVVVEVVEHVSMVTAVVITTGDAQGLWAGEGGGGGVAKG